MEAAINDVMKQFRGREGASQRYHRKGGRPGKEGGKEGRSMHNSLHDSRF